jgi:hypothetical protein
VLVLKMSSGDGQRQRLQDAAAVPGELQVCDHATRRVHSIMITTAPPMRS